MPVIHATYTCKHCNETFDTTSETEELTDCPCGKTRVRPKPGSTEYGRGSEFETVSRVTKYFAHDFTEPTPRTLELIDKLEQLKKQREEYGDHTKPRIWNYKMTQTLHDDSVVIESFSSSIDASNGSTYSGESNEIKVSLRFEKDAWGYYHTAQKIEERLERYVAVIDAVYAGTLDPTNRRALKEYAESNHLHDNEEPTGATHYEMHI